ncbi:MAG TPA: 1-(5-phosphoribosyl)-5-[(5-phosphoribosylamino)methylideneamino]imidazole-4-carboxamide isomerase [Rhodanobacteraceae bacterium]
MSFVVYPAIDLRDGHVVRLYQGDYARQTDYAVTPLEQAQSYLDAGAQWLHVVDLDGARSGNSYNLDVIAAIAKLGLKVQAGGGVREEADLLRLFDVGVRRVVVGSLSVRDPDRVCRWLQQYGPERLTIALDTRFRDGQWRLPSAGWERDENVTLDELAPRYAAAGARHVLCTDIDRDGTLAGPNVLLAMHLAKLAPGLEVQVSGGVRELDDIRTARRAGAGGIVLGRSLLEGKFTAREALAC